MTRPSSAGAAIPAGTRQEERAVVQRDQRVGDGRPEHEHGAVREVEDVEHAEDERVSDGEQRVDGPDEDCIEELLDPSALKSTEVGDRGGPRSLSSADLVDQREAALAIHRDDPHRLLHVVVRVNWNGPSGVWMLTSPWRRAACRGPG